MSKPKKLPVIRVQMSLLIHYDKANMGDTARAAMLATALESKMMEEVGVTVETWSATQTTVLKDEA